MVFKPLSTVEKKQLLNALSRNANEDKPIMMDRRNTSFLDYEGEVTDNEVISAICSVPCHY